MKKILSLLITVCLLLSLTGCGGDQEITFTLTLPGAPATLDPQVADGAAARQVLASLFEGLCRVGPDGSPQPGVAERWEANADASEFTFHLRRARWSDGSSVTARDFVTGITRALSPERGSFPQEMAMIRGAAEFFQQLAGPEDLGVQARDDHTLVISLAHGYPDFPLLTAGVRYMPCQREFFDECAGHYGQSAAYLLTNGPFTFPHGYAWDTDYGQRKISLVRANEYRGERKIHPTALTYLIDYDEALDEDPLTALSDGAADLLPLTESQAAAAEDRGCGILSVPDGVMGLLLNQDCDALRLPEARALFFKTLDRESLLTLGVTDTRPEAVGIMPDAVRWQGDAYYALGETAYPAQEDAVIQSLPAVLSLMQWESLPAITVLCPDDEDSVRLANGFLLCWNGKLGTAFNIRPMPESELQRRIAAGEYEAALYTLRSGGATPLDALLTAADLAFPPLDQDAARSFDFHVVLRDLTYSRESFRDMENALAEQNLFYPLVKRNSYYGLAPKVSGLTVSADGWIDFARGKH